MLERQLFLPAPAVLYSDVQKPSRMRSEPNHFAFARCDRDCGRTWLNGAGGRRFA
jgi:hypothetical protein